MSVRFDRSEENNGPYRTAERLITRALEKSESVIFSKDDLIFEHDAIEWFERALAASDVPASECVGVSPVNRDFLILTGTVLPTPTYPMLLALAESHNLIDKFVYLDLCHQVVSPLLVRSGLNSVKQEEAQEVTGLWWIVVWRKGKSVSGQS